MLVIHFLNFYSFDIIFIKHLNSNSDIYYYVLRYYSLSAHFNNFVSYFKENVDFAKNIENHVKFKSLCLLSHPITSLLSHPIISLFSHPITSLLSHPITSLLSHPITNRLYHPITILIFVHS